MPSLYAYAVVPLEGLTGSFSKIPLASNYCADIADRTQDFQAFVRLFQELGIAENDSLFVLQRGEKGFVRPAYGREETHAVIKFDLNKVSEHTNALMEIRTKKGSTFFLLSDKERSTNFTHAHVPQKLLMDMIEEIAVAGSQFMPKMAKMPELASKVRVRRSAFMPKKMRDKGDKFDFEKAQPEVFTSRPIQPKVPTQKAAITPAKEQATAKVEASAQAASGSEAPVSVPSNTKDAPLKGQWQSPKGSLLWVGPVMIEDSDTCLTMTPTKILLRSSFMPCSQATPDDESAEFTWDFASLAQTFEAWEVPVNQRFVYVYQARGGSDEMQVVGESNTIFSHEDWQESGEKAIAIRAPLEAIGKRVSGVYCFNQETDKYVADSYDGSKEVRAKSAWDSGLIGYLNDDSAADYASLQLWEL